MYYYIVASGSKGNATIVVDKDIVILIDMGIAFSRFEEELSKINVSTKDINAALFTHNHTDHINGLKFIPIKKQYALEGTLPSSGHNVVELFKNYDYSFNLDSYINDNTYQETFNKKLTDLLNGLLNEVDNTFDWVLEFEEDLENIAKALDSFTTKYFGGSFDINEYVNYLFEILEI